MPAGQLREHNEVLQVSSESVSGNEGGASARQPSGPPVWIDDASRADLARLKVDFLAFGSSVLTPQSVRIADVIHQEGDVNDPAATMHSHCASLLAMWGTVRAPTVVDLGECLCIGKRLLPRASRHGRRFAVHAMALQDELAAFGVISSNKPWPETSQAKSRIHSLTENFHNFMRSSSACAKGNTPLPSPKDLDWFSFSAREVQILQLLARGLSNKMIARELGSSPNTIRNQIHAVFRKTAVSNRTELALRAAWLTRASRA